MKLCLHFTAALRVASGCPYGVDIAGPAAGVHRMSDQANPGVDSDLLGGAGMCLPFLDYGLNTGTVSGFCPYSWDSQA